MSSFQESLAFVLNIEGGVSHVKEDRGGYTKFGITKHTLERWRQRPVSPDEVLQITREEAAKIYKAYYWAPLKLDQVSNSNLATVIFDQGVNRGISAVTKNLQEILGVVQDGEMGPKTINALKLENQKRVALRLIKKTQIAYSKIVQHDPTQRIFLVGWINRSHKLLDLLYSS